MKPIAAIIALAAAAALTACASLVRDRIYHPPTARLSPAGLGPDVREIGVATADGLALTGLERPPSGDMPVLLFFHGNASSASGVMAWLRPLLDHGYGFVSAEYRGYSGNPGSPTQAGLARDADAFHDRARLLAGSRPLIVVGHSLGGGVAFDLALRHRLDALVTIGTFASVRDVAPRIARALIPDPFDNRAAIARLDEPLFLIHGDRDDVIPLWHARELQQAAAAAKRRGAAIVLAGQGHQPDAAVVTMAVDAIRESGNDAGRLARAHPEGARVVPF